MHGGESGMIDEDAATWLKWSVVSLDVMVILLYSAFAYGYFTSGDQWLSMFSIAVAVLFIPLTVRDLKKSWGDGGGE
jgi:uncharacterized membrane protein